MSLPHVCECRICGATFPLGHPLGLPAGVELPAEPPLPPGWEAFKTVLNELEPAAQRATCTHGYTVCMPCKFPSPEVWK